MAAKKVKAKQTTGGAAGAVKRPKVGLGRANARIKKLTAAIDKLRNLAYAVVIPYKDGAKSATYKKALKERQELYVLIQGLESICKEQQRLVKVIKGQDKSNFDWDGEDHGEDDDWDDDSDDWF